MRASQRSRNKPCALWAILLAGVIGSTQASNYSNVYFFGDSMSDSGAYAPLVGQYARFTNSPGTMWTENFGANYGKTVTSAYAAFQTGGPNEPGGFTPIVSGNNFAVGGARVNAVPGNISGLPGLKPFIPPVSTQVTDFLARGSVDSRALYAVVAGANDVIYQTTLLKNGIITSEAATAAMETAAHDFVTQIERLQAAGVRKLIVLSIPDLGMTPAATATGSQALLGSLTATYNATQAAGIAGKNLLYFDGNKLFTAIFANPAAYGFTDTTTPVCHGAALGCQAAANGHLFADIVHWSSSLHAVLSDWMISSLEGARRVGLLSQIPLANSEAQWRSIDGRLREFQNFGYQGQGFFVTGDYASSRMDANPNLPSASGSGGNFVLGYEKAFTEQLFGGVTLGYGNAPFDLGSNQGSIKFDAWALSAFVSNKVGNFYANASATYSRLDYESRRNVMLGAFSTTERGNTHGSQFGAKGQIGYHFHGENLLHGPLLGLSWEKVSVDGFSEQSNSLTAMTFGNQTRESLRSKIGWQVAANTSWSGAKVRPYTQLTYDYEHKKGERTYSAGFVGGNSAMEMPIANQTGGYGTLLVGVNTELSKAMRLGIGASTTISQPGSRNSAISVTLGSAF